ncbi:25586_t:CDS:2 [Gigaspora margarita]|uniref:25586_t:CDS:1 n=1 Tax=Gigaspora margarita TaxID=4874 RepID=A0ABN7W532_GIGMA|nr:25586_t:CDS:2 [Gigaspora margarita]
MTLCNPTSNKQKLLNEVRTACKEIKNKNKVVIHEKIQLYLTTAPSTIHIQCNFIVHTSFNKASTFTVALSLSISLVILLQLDNSDTIVKNVVAKLRAKKQKQLDDEGIIEKYDKPEQKLAAILNSNLWDNIYDCIEFGPAHAKR